MAAKLDASAERDPTHNGTRIVLRFAASRRCAEIDQRGGELGLIAYSA